MGSQVVEWRDSEHEGLGVDSIASECYREPPAVSFRN